MIGLGAALTGRGGLATAGPKFVKGPGHRLGVLSIPRWFLVSHVHLLVVRKAVIFA